MPDASTIHRHADAESLAHAVAARWLALAQSAIAARGVFHVALSGGSTPRRLYQLLAGEPYRSRADFPRTRLWLGDERCVPADHPDSNYRMAREAFGDAVPPDCLRRVETGLSPEEAASRYTDQLRQQLPQSEGWPCFDLILLGMGTDGHTASLFPGTTILDEDHRIMAAVYVDKCSAWRVSLTLPTINHARHALFLVVGADKAEMVSRILTEGATDLPAARVQPAGGADWHLDAAAAARLRP